MPMAQRTISTVVLPALIATFNSGARAHPTCDGFNAGVSHTGNSTEEPLGGGDGYGDIVDPMAADIVVDYDDPAAFVMELQGADENAVIYINDDLEIDLTDWEGIYIPEGVTLASGRGRRDFPDYRPSKGALIFTTEYVNSLFEIETTRVRMTGLRIRGPGHNDQVATGVRSKDWIKIDNCEFFNWSNAAIDVRVDGYVYNNSIHHNFGYLGYGVLVAGPTANARVRGNIFNANWHSIAATGDPLLSYLAFDNLVLWSNVPEAKHAFDAHANCEPGNEVEGSPWAGSFDIRNNTFLLSAKHAVRARGTPAEKGNVLGNAFATSVADGVQNDNLLGVPNGGFCPDEPVCLVRHTQNYSDTCSDDVIYHPDYSLSPPESPGAGWYFDTGASVEGWLIPPEYYNVDDNCEGVNRWLVSRGATDDWKLLADSEYTASEVGFGDFDDDGVTDIFLANGSNWQVSRDGMGAWDTLNNSGITLESLGFGDFDGDGETDVFRKNSSNIWQVSWSGTGSWFDVGSSSAAFSDYRFHDFNGDGRTDIFRRSGGSWYVSFSEMTWSDHSDGMTPWRLVKDFNSTSVAPIGSGGSIANLRFADFDGDHSTDIFATEGGDWHVFYGPDGCNILTTNGCNMGAQGWEDDLDDSAEVLSNLAFGDFNGDGVADVLNISSSTQHFRVKWSGVSDSWETLGLAPPFSMSDMVIHDFNNDGIDDVFVSHQD